MPLDPAVAARLARFRAAAQTPAPPPSSPQERRARALAAETAAWRALGVEARDVDVVDVVVPVPHPAAPDVRVRLYRPPGRTDALPGVLQFFGGAFRQGGLHQPVADWQYRERAAEGGVVVIGVDYALAPEHRYPAAVEQGVAVLEWAREHGAEHGIDPERLALGGQSSGGNLAACTALRNRDRAGVPVAFQLLEVPVLDLTTGHMSFELLDEVGIPRAFVEADHASIRDDYFGPGNPPDPDASPLLARSLAGLPPTYLMLAEYDVLRGDGEAFHARLRAEGVPSSATVALGQTHESMGDPTQLASRHWQATVVALLRTLHPAAVPAG
ncbi:alpha/beta hydrolase [Gryllotalpicola ginsengisoli]|uniref:alpha/beta hydrolase n=1 Tax=Gryllotalpicola ginsengisoli TaxID=444608 RepID=UPI0003B45386|nr:alpha/beta hydrolase [Gryllotalpicola ginsengisoli]